MAKTEYFKHRTVDFRLTVLFSCNETERTDNMNDNDFIQELKTKREEYGISQSRFAVACGCNLRRAAATGAFASGHSAEHNGHLY